MRTLSLRANTASVNTPFNPREYPLYPASQGERHGQLLSFAGHLRHFGAEEPELAEQLFEADRRFDCPRKPPGEICKLAHYAAEHWTPGIHTSGPLSFDIPGRALGWIKAHCFAPFFSGKRGCMDFSVLYTLICLIRRSRRIDVNASCRDIALAAGCTPITASRSLRRLRKASYIARVGKHRMDEAQAYCLSTDLCTYPQEAEWVELTSAMFKVSRAATKLQLICGDRWLTQPLSTSDTRTLVGQDALRVSNTRRYSARRTLRRKRLNSLEKAEDGEDRLKRWMQFEHERRMWRGFVADARSAKRRTRGQKGHLVMKMAA